MSTIIVIEYQHLDLADFALSFSRIVRIRYYDCRITLMLMQSLISYWVVVVNEVTILCKAALNNLVNVLHATVYGAKMF